MSKISSPPEILRNIATNEPFPHGKRGQWNDTSVLPLLPCGNGSFVAILREIWNDTSVLPTKAAGGLVSKIAN